MLLQRSFGFSTRRIFIQAQGAQQNYIMLRLRTKLILHLLAVSSVMGRTTTSAGRFTWDDSSADRTDYYPSGPLIWPRIDDLPLLLESRDVERLPVVKRSVDLADDLPAVARDLPAERISKSSREPRTSFSEGWSKQQNPAVQSRKRVNQERLDSYEDGDEIGNPPGYLGAHYAPKTDFVTSVRSRAVLEGRPLFLYPEGRESRDTAILRAYDDYEVPVFRNIVREHDFDVQIPRTHYHPSRYGAQRDYYYRGAAGGAAVASPYVYDRYRDDDEDYELYGRYRPTPKPKRIIYYATLPEVVRKPIDLRNYPRPYDAFVRPEVQSEVERNRVTANAIEPNRKPPRYPYDNYDNYVKRSSYYDRKKPPYAAGVDNRPRETERSRVNYKDKIHTDDRKSDNQIARSGDNYDMPWPVQIGTEINVKSNDRVPGRNIFSQMEDYERYDGSRVKKISGNAERKEDRSESDNNDNNGNSNINNN